jgi:hypothetical protein
MDTPEDRLNIDNNPVENSIRPVALADHPINRIQELLPHRYKI